MPRVYFSLGGHWFHAGATAEVLQALGIPAIASELHARTVDDPMPAADAELEQYLHDKWPQFRRGDE